MKIVGLIVILLNTIVSDVSFASIMDCKGNMYTRLNDGGIGVEKLKIMEKPLIDQEMTVVAKDGKISFETKKKSDEWIYYTDRNNNEMLFITGYRNQNTLKYTDMRLDKASFFKFRDNSIVGFNIICRM